MRLAENSHLKLERFFREITDEKSFRLPAVRIYAGRFSAILTRVLNIHGITIGKTIFLAPQVVSLSRDDRTTIEPELAAHEIAHVLQYGREGFIVFLYRYLTSYARNLRAEKTLGADGRRRAYLEIPFEIEARAQAAAFVEWNR